MRCCSRASLGSANRDWRPRSKSSGETARGIGQMTDGLSILRQQGPRALMTLAHWLMADAHLMAHHYREGLEVAQPLDFADTGDQSWLARLHHLHGKLLLHPHGSDDESVEASMRQAISLARRQCAKGWELPATTSLARLWLDRGRRSEARELLAPDLGAVRPLRSYISSPNGDAAPCYRARSAVSRFPDWRWRDTEGNAARGVRLARQAEREVPARCRPGLWTRGHRGRPRVRAWPGEATGDKHVREPRRTVLLSSAECRRNLVGLGTQPRAPPPSRHVLCYRPLCRTITVSPASTK